MSSRCSSDSPWPYSAQMTKAPMPNVISARDASCIRRRGARRGAMWQGPYRHLDATQRGIEKPDFRSRAHTDRQEENTDDGLPDSGADQGVTRLVRRTPDPFAVVEDDHGSGRHDGHDTLDDHPDEGDGPGPSRCCAEFLSSRFALRCLRVARRSVGHCRFSSSVSNLAAQSVIRKA